MPQRWGIWFAVEGDLRFGSHHDMMRTTGRIAIRARLPLRYSQGFNPHPILSLAFPRPVGVASHDDLLVLTLDTNMPAEDILARLNENAPRGMRFTRAEPLAVKNTPRARSADYQLTLPTEPTEKIPAVSARLAEIKHQDAWYTERSTPAKRRGRAAGKTIDLKPLVQKIDLRDGELRWTQVPRGDQWARPREVLALLGLDPRADLAKTVRTNVKYEYQQDLSRA